MENAQATLKNTRRTMSDHQKDQKGMHEMDTEGRVGSGMERCSKELAENGMELHVEQRDVVPAVNETDNNINGVKRGSFMHQVSSLMAQPSASSDPMLTLEEALALLGSYSSCDRCKQDGNCANGAAGDSHPPCATNTSKHLTPTSVAALARWIQSLRIEALSTVSIPAWAFLVSSPLCWSDSSATTFPPSSMSRSATLSPSLRVEHHAAKQVIVREGAVECDDIFILLRGSVSLWKERVSTDEGGVDGNDSGNVEVDPQHSCTDTVVEGEGAKPNTGSDASAEECEATQSTNVTTKSKQCFDELVQKLGSVPHFITQHHAPMLNGVAGDEIRTRSRRSSARSTRWGRRRSITLLHNREQQPLQVEPAPTFGELKLVTNQIRHKATLVAEGSHADHADGETIGDERTDEDVAHTMSDDRDGATFLIISKQHLQRALQWSDLTRQRIAPTMYDLSLSPPMDAATFLRTKLLLLSSLSLLRSLSLEQLSKIASSFQFERVGLNCRIVQQGMRTKNMDRALFLVRGCAEVRQHVDVHVKSDDLDGEAKQNGTDEEASKRLSTDGRGTSPHHSSSSSKICISLGLIGPGDLLTEEALFDPPTPPRTGTASRPSSSMPSAYTAMPTPPTSKRTPLHMYEHEWEIASGTSGGGAIIASIPASVLRPFLNDAHLLTAARSLAMEKRARRNESRERLIQRFRQNDREKLQCREGRSGESPRPISTCKAQHAAAGWQHRSFYPPNLSKPMLSTSANRHHFMHHAYTMHTSNRHARMKEKARTVTPMPSPPASARTHPATPRHIGLLRATSNPFQSGSSASSSRATPRPAAHSSPPDDSVHSLESARSMQLEPSFDGSSTGTSQSSTYHVAASTHTIPQSILDRFFSLLPPFSSNFSTSSPFFCSSSAPPTSARRSSDRSPSCVSVLDEHQPMRLSPRTVRAHRLRINASGMVNNFNRPIILSGFNSSTTGTSIMPSVNTQNQAHRPTGRDKQHQQTAPTVGSPASSLAHRPPHHPAPSTPRPPSHSRTLRRRVTDLLPDDDEPASWQSFYPIVYHTRPLELALQRMQALEKQRAVERRNMRQSNIICALMEC